MLIRCDIKDQKRRIKINSEVFGFVLFSYPAIFKMSGVVNIPKVKAKAQEIRDYLDPPPDKIYIENG